jgi:hypothetical protein
MLALVVEFCDWSLIVDLYLDLWTPLILAYKILYMGNCTSRTPFKYYENWTYHDPTGEP